jgi:hypothetical protein
VAIADVIADARDEATSSVVLAFERGEIDVASIFHDDNRLLMRAPGYCKRSRNNYPTSECR